MFKCPSCGEVKASRTYATSPIAGGEIIHRRRKCLACEHKWTTYEGVSLGLGDSSPRAIPTLETRVAQHLSQYTARQQKDGIPFETIRAALRCGSSELTPILKSLGFKRYRYRSEHEEQRRWYKV